MMKPSIVVRAIVSVALLVRFFSASFNSGKWSGGLEIGGTQEASMKLKTWPAIQSSCFSPTLRQVYCSLRCGCLTKASSAQPEVHGKAERNQRGELLSA
jgi:hypothetical protein